MPADATTHRKERISGDFGGIFLGLIFGLGLGLGLGIWSEFMIHDSRVVFYFLARVFLFLYTSRNFLREVLNS